MPKLITVYWRDIPSQVIAKKGRTTSKVQLSQRFQSAIDRAAMRAGKGSSDAYLSEWRREASTCGDDLESAAKELAHALEPVSYTHLRAHETPEHLLCRLVL